MRWSSLAVVGALGVCFASAADGAETVHLNLRVNNAEIQGESTQTSLGRANTIECVELSYAARTTAEGKRTHDAIRCVKRIDKASPLLFKAWRDGATVDGTFKFFRPNPTGDGTTEQFFTLDIKGGRIESTKLLVKSTIEPATSTCPPLEEVTFTFRTITLTFTKGSVTGGDTWAGK